jgi:hypothetical protein
MTISSRTKRKWRVMQRSHNKKDPLFKDLLDIFRIKEAVTFYSKNARFHRSIAASFLFRFVLQIQVKRVLYRLKETASR